MRHHRHRQSLRLFASPLVVFRFLARHQGLRLFAVYDPTERILQPIEYEHMHGNVLGT
jgi:hypothetical protein